MDDWKELEIETFEVPKETICSNVFNAITAKERSDFWIAEVDLHVKYKVFRSLKDMAEEIWADWPSNHIEGFIDENIIHSQLPIIEAKHERQYYIFKNREIAQRFLKSSIKFVETNDID